MSLSKVWLFSQIYIEDHFITGAPTHLCIPHMNEEKAAISVEVTFKQSLES